MPANLSPRPSLRRAALAAALLTASAAVASCAGAPPVTKIEQGEVYKTGTAKYDEYFEEVLGLRTEAAKAVGERHRVEDQLRGAIGSTAQSVEDLLEGARKKASELKEKGHLLHLQLTPEVKLVVSAAKGSKPDPALEKMAHEIEEAVRNSLVLATKLRDLRAKAEGLGKRREGLVTEASASFATEPGSKRSTVDRELDMSKKVLELARDDGEKQAGLASYLVLELAGALETGAVPGAQPLPKGWKPPPGVAVRLPPKPAGTVAAPPPPPQGPTKPASTQVKPPPPPPPKKPPKKGGDFDP